MKSLFYCKLCSKKQGNLLSVFLKFSQIQQRSERKTRVNLIQLLVKIVKRDTHRITCHYSAELQTLQLAKHTFTTSKNSIEFTHSDFLCHLKVNRDKPVLINRLWKQKKGERLTISTNSFSKIDQLDGFHPLWRSG